MSETSFPASGRCTCDAVRYRIATAPLIVHCCHCRWCQRETGTAFALNAMIETDRVTLLRGDVEAVDIPSQSGKGQTIVRCPQCRIALWSHYAGGGRALSFVRVGTLDDPDLCPPDVHIYTRSKQSWVAPAAGTPAFTAYYKRQSVWPPDSLARLRALREG